MAFDPVDQRQAAGAVPLSVPAWVGRYIGIPFADDGHGMQGCNCWGLCHLVLKYERRIETPTFGETSAGELIAAARHFRSNAADLALWRSVDTPREFDICLMTAMTDDCKHRLPGHVGIMISGHRVLHVWEATAACHMPVDHPRLRHRILSYHRHRDLP